MKRTFWLLFLCGSVCGAGAPALIYLTRSAILAIVAGFGFLISFPGIMEGKFCETNGRPRLATHMARQTGFWAGYLIVGLIFAIIICSFFLGS